MLTVGSLFSGIGLLDYGLHLAGLHHAWFCESDEWRRSILRKRWPGVPVYDDVRAVGAGAPRVDVVAGGFPCKGLSSAGKRTGFGHPETVLWREQIRCIRELQPRYVLVENVADLLRMHDGECFAEVLGGLAESGFDCWWDCLPARAFGAAHRRDRVFVLAYARGRGCGPSVRPLHAGQPDAERRGEVPATDSSSLGARGPAGQAYPVTGGGEAREEPLRGDRDAGPATADAERERGERWRGTGDMAGAGAGPQGETRQRQRGRHAPVDRGSASPDSDLNGRQGRQEHDGAGATRGLEVGAAPESAGRGVAVGWGEYEPAVRRWEDILGRLAPEPLVRRVADGDTSRVDRSRLSALGDGVLVQAGWLVGRMIVDHAQEGELAA